MDINIKIQCPNCGKDLGENINDKDCYRYYHDLSIRIIPDVCDKCYVDMSVFETSEKEKQQISAEASKNEYELENALTKINEQDLRIREMENQIYILKKTISDFNDGMEYETEPPIVM